MSIQMLEMEEEEENQIYEREKSNYLIKVWASEVDGLSRAEVINVLF